MIDAMIAEKKQKEKQIKEECKIEEYKKDPDNVKNVLGTMVRSLKKHIVFKRAEKVFVITDDN